MIIKIYEIPDGLSSIRNLKQAIFDAEGDLFSSPFLLQFDQTVFF
jgi:hypothetical protein